MSQEFDIDALLQEEQDQMLKGNYPNPFEPEFIIVIFIHRELLFQFFTVVDEDDLKWVANEKKVSLLINSSMTIFVVKTLGFRKLDHSSEMQNDASWLLKGFKLWNIFV